MYIHANIVKLALKWLQSNMLSLTKKLGHTFGIEIILDERNYSSILKALIVSVYCTVVLCLMYSEKPMEANLVLQAQKSQFAKGYSSDRILRASSKKL